MKCESLSKSKHPPAPKDYIQTNIGTTSNSGCPSFVIVAEPSVPNGEVSNVPHGEICSDYSEWWRWSFRYNSKLGLPLIRNRSRKFLNGGAAHFGTTPNSGYPSFVIVAAYHDWWCCSHHMFLTYLGFPTEPLQCVSSSKSKLTQAPKDRQEVTWKSN